MDPKFDHMNGLTRRHFLGTTMGVGAIAWAALNGVAQAATPANPLATRPSHFAGKAKRVIYLHMAGSPPPMDLFDYKPKLNEFNGKLCPDEMMEKERFAFIKGHPKILGSPHSFKQYGQSGTYLSNLLPHLSTMTDEMTFIRSMYTEQFNHAPAQLLLHTGSARLGRPSMGSWATYGLGVENQDLPGFVVMVSGDKTPDAGKSVWGSGFLPTIHQGVQCRSKGEPVLYVSDPKGMDRDLRRRSLDAINRINEAQYESMGDPETLTRISQYELAFRMQVSVPEVMDISKESPETLAWYGATPGESSFANNCLLARRLVEQNVRFVQLFDWGWDTHGTGPSDDIVTQLPKKCGLTDRPITALLRDLQQRGLLEETLVVWSGEFGRTAMNEERDGSKFLGRDHNPNAFTIWMAGGGVKRGFNYGATDDFGYRVAENPVHVHDLQASILHLLGMDHLHLTFPFQGRDFRLTDVHGNVVHDILA